MDGSIIGKRYAKALINLVADDKEIEEIGQELREVAELYQEEPVFKAVILDPKFSKTKKIDIIDKVTHEMKCRELVSKYCRFLSFKKRFNIIGNISASYNKLANEKLGRLPADIVVAHELSGKEKSELQKQLSDYTGKTITFGVKVDESILGGAITSIGSLVIDGSIKNRLNLIRETIISKGN